VPRPRKLARGRVVAVYLEEQQVELLRAVAEVEGVSVSELVRRALSEWLEEARVRYGLQFAIAEVKPSGSALDAVAEKYLEDVTRVLGEVKPVVQEARRRLPELRRRVGELLERRRQLLETPRDTLVCLNGRWIPAREAVREEVATIDAELSRIREELSRYYEARRRFFRLVYRRWERVKREVSSAARVRVSQDVALVLRWLDEVDPQLSDLWRLVKGYGRRDAKAKRK
jgi:hypothetical protein